MKHESIARVRRRSVNLSIDADMITEAKALGVNVSKVCEASLATELKRVRNERWREENREAMLAWHDWIEENGLPLAEYRQF